MLGKRKEIYYENKNNFKMYILLMLCIINKRFRKNTNISVCATTTTLFNSLPKAIHR